MNLGPTPADRARWDELERNCSHDPEHPRERQEAEDDKSRHHDFAAGNFLSAGSAEAATTDPSGGRVGAVAPVGPPAGGGGPHYWEIHAWTP